jgi:hypothetical protein
MNGKDYVKETKEDIDYLIKEAIKECEESMYGTYDAADCICQRLKKLSWIDEKLSVRRVEKGKT